jgi:RIO kinase 1
VQPSLPVHRPAPAWLIDDAFEDRQLGVLKSGKEAEVFLVERRSASGSCLLAHKRYRPRRPGKGELRALGFSKGTAYHNDNVYHQGWHLKSRDQRAVDQATRHGQELVTALWPLNETQMLRRAWQAGASVPYPVELTAEGLIMEYLGDETQAAPRLVQARLGSGELSAAWQQLRASLRALVRAGVVHADLSAYNLLWWRGRLTLIDFPQAVDVITNAHAPDLLHRDLLNVATWFGRRGLAIDPEAEYAALLEEMF